MKHLKGILSFATFVCLSLNGELKESFSFSDRIQLLKMSTFGPTAQMLNDLNTSYSDDLVPDEIEWLEEQLNFPSAYDDPDDEWLTHFERTEQIATYLMPSVDFYEERGVLISIDGMAEIEQITEQLETIVG